MFKIKTLPHIADVRFRIQGDSLEDIFQGGLHVLNQTLKKGFCREQKEYPDSIKLRIRSVDQTVLLVDFLSEVLTYSNTNYMIYCAVEFDVLEETELDATISGIPVSGFEEDIKAVTYHEAEIHIESDGKCWTNIIFDI